MTVDICLKFSLFALAASWECLPGHHARLAVAPKPVRGDHIPKLDFDFLYNMYFDLFWRPVCFLCSELLFFSSTSFRRFCSDRFQPLQIRRQDQSFANENIWASNLFLYFVFIWIILFCWVRFELHCEWAGPHQGAWVDVSFDFPKLWLHSFENTIKLVLLWLQCGSIPEKTRRLRCWIDFKLWFS